MATSGTRGPHDDHPELASRNARAGLVLFFVYLAFYGGFMLLATFLPELMARPTPVGGVNLAIVYGVGLIAGALVIAAIYMWLCGRNAHFSDASQKRSAEGDS